MNIRCVLHGSFRRNYDEIKRVRRIFMDAGIDIVAPTDADVTGICDGFTFLQGEEDKDPRLVELLYLHHLRRLGEHGFSYFVDPGGEIGRSASYELGIAQVTNVRCFFMERPTDHPVYVHGNSVWRPEDLATYIAESGTLPSPNVRQDERAIHRLWEDLMVPGSIVATGGIIEFDGDASRREKDILLVRTHKWGGRWSVVGGRVRRNERLSDALLREVEEETGLRGRVGAHLCTFDQIKHSGYYQGGMQHIFVDNVVHVNERRVRLNDEAQEFVWMPARHALRDLDIEPNARHTLELYVERTI